MRFLEIFALLSLVCVSCLAYPMSYPMNVDIMSVGDDFVAIRFSSLSEADFYSVDIRRTNDEYTVNPFVEEIPASSAPNHYVEFNASIFLEPSQSYTVIITTAITTEGILDRLVTGEATFVANDCASGMFCSRLGHDSPQCFKPEWLCNGVVNCGDELDEINCDDPESSRHEQNVGIGVESSTTTATASSVEGSTTTEHSTVTTTSTQEATESPFPCLDAQEAANQWARENPGITEGAPNWPLCSPDGSYYPYQCTVAVSETTTCTCVDKNGVELIDAMSFGTGDEDYFYFQDDCFAMRGPETESTDTESYESWEHYDDW